jgi:glycosyltransferase involved in cell wall biosynthesis
MRFKFVRFNDKRYGGNILRDKIKNALARVAPCEYFTLTESKTGMKGKIKALINLFRIEGRGRNSSEREIVIREYWSALTKVRKNGTKNILNIFHIDNSVVSFGWVHGVLEKLFYRHLKNFDTVTVMSKYWKEHFTAAGHPDVRLLYPGFDMAEYGRTEEDAESFKRKYGLNGKPLVYIGNAQKAKGAVESYDALKSLDVTLVTSGREEVDIPVGNLDLSFVEFVTLLKAADIVVTMSLFNEGWCMVAHEAMLMKTPVIGSGRGGMRELLEGGGQIVCENFTDLRGSVEKLLSDPDGMKNMGKNGYEYASAFTMERFTNDWTGFAESMAREN